jgi:hypothetical protein
MAESLYMSKALSIIENSIEWVKSTDVIIERRPLFTWAHGRNSFPEEEYKLPWRCNAIGAVLIKLGVYSKYRNNIPNNFLEEVCNHIGEPPFWLWRFVSGFDYGNQITFITMEKDKEIKIPDKISRYANSLAMRVCSR